MSRRLYPHKRVRYWYAYDIDDICTLFSEFSLHPQTVRKWINDGLKTIDKCKPSLVYGNDLIAYLNFCKCKRHVANVRARCSRTINYWTLQSYVKSSNWLRFWNYMMMQNPALRLTFMHQTKASQMSHYKENSFEDKRQKTKSIQRH